MEFHLEAAANVNKVIALAGVRGQDFTRREPAHRSGPASCSGLSVARQEALNGFRRENAVWAVLAACALGLLAASLLG